MAFFTGFALERRATQDKACPIAEDQYVPWINAVWQGSARLGAAAGEDILFPAVTFRAGALLIRRVDTGSAARQHRSQPWTAYISSPERSFGSNQVDFGGITSPRSATANNASSEVG